MMAFKEHFERFEQARTAFLNVDPKKAGVLAETMTAEMAAMEKALEAEMEEEKKFRAVAEALTRKVNELKEETERRPSPAPIRAATQRMRRTCRDILGIGVAQEVT